MKCPNCRVYDVDVRSLAGWCTKCTGVFTSQKLVPLCMACNLKEADPRSDGQLCTACHRRVTGESLDQPREIEDADDLSFIRAFIAKLNALFERTSEECPRCGQHVESLQQVQRSVYVRPCGCRLGQGHVPDVWKTNP